MHKYIKHVAAWDASNPVAIFSKQHTGNGNLQITAAICIGGGKVEEGDLIESLGYLANGNIKVYKVSNISERFTPKGHWIIPNEDIGFIATLEPFVSDIETYLESN